MTTTLETRTPVRIGLHSRDLRYVNPVVTPRYGVHTAFSIDDVNGDIRAIKAANPALMIAGATPMHVGRVPGAGLIPHLMGSGIIVARYSKFYGGRDGYVGLSPEASGYALDFPKDRTIVDLTLSHEGLLEGIVARDERKIREAVGELNASLSRCYDTVRITPYLHDVLRH